MPAKPPEKSDQDDSTLEKENDKMGFLQHQSNSIVQRLKFFRSEIKSKKKTISSGELQSIQKRISQLYTKYDDVQSEIEFLNLTEYDSSKRNEFETLYGTLEAEIIQLYTEREQQLNKPKDNASTSSPSSSKSGENRFPSTAVKLPDIQLPNFSGEWEDWLNFKNVYIELIHLNKNLTNTSKFHYLLSCTVAGKAHQLISSLPTTAENYDTAWKLLVDEYDNETKIARKHMRNIYELPYVKENSSQSLKIFIDLFWKDYRALSALKYPVSNWDLFLVHHLSTKLDVMSRKEIETQTPTDKIQSVQEFIDILSRRVRVLDAIAESANTSTKSHRSAVKPISAHKVQRTLTISTASKCIICSENHSIFKCEKFNLLPVNQRLEKVKNLNLCTNCLNSKHTNKMCQFGSCRVCHKKHHTLLHIYSTAVNDSTNAVTLNNTIQSSNKCNQVLLPIAIVNVFDISGNVHQCRALIDSASQCNLITSNLVQQLKLHKRKEYESVIGLGGNLNSIKFKTEALIGSRLSEYKISLTFKILHKITDKLPGEEIIFNDFYLSDEVRKKLADPLFCHPSQIDLLIGAEIFNDIILHDKLIVHRSLPALTNSVFGYIAIGKVYSEVESVKPTASLVCTLGELNNQVQRFWDAETISDDKESLSLEEKECENHYLRNLSRDPSGRYTVTLPVKKNIMKLGKSREFSLKLFQRLEKRLSKNIDIKQQYHDFMKEYIELGHMNLVSNENSDNSDSPVDESVEFYMPHHEVLKPSSLTTKLRVVFNASFKSDSGLSLNDVLKTGPMVQQDLFSILIRFRKHYYALVADVAKMYRQIQVKAKQRCLQRIFWRFDDSQPIQTYELSTVTYGTACASYLATRTLKQVAIDEASLSHEASKVVISDFCVDDLLTGSYSVSAAIKLCYDVKDILKKGCFELRKWASNNSEVLCNLDKTEKIEGSEANILGFTWNFAQDVMVITNKNVKFHSVFTKRSVLSTISSLYDPLGVCAPVTFAAKVFLQSIWSVRSLDWDDEIPNKMKSYWANFSSQLKNLVQVYFPRNVIPVESTQIVEIQIHGFGDASQLGYGCCIYIRTTDVANNHHVRLLCAKTRIAPSKHQTIPRMELCASLLLSQLTRKVTKALDLQFNRIFLWSDSEITLFRIKSNSSKFKTFVANRISQIQESTDMNSWRYVPSLLNPADKASRGLLPSQLESCEIWWNGPKFLYSNEDEWPLNDHFSEEFNTEELELKESSAVSLAATKSPTEFNFIERVSDFNKLVRYTAIWIRYMKNLRLAKDQRIFGAIKVDEFEHALKVLIIIVQGQMFHSCIKRLSNQQNVEKSSKLRDLHPFLDKSGIIRVGGRLTHSDHISYDQKHPIVLLDKHHFSNILVRHYHLKNLHIGPQALLHEVRQRFWITRGKNLCKKIFRNCIKCFRTNPTTSQQLMGDLPIYRVQPNRPFINVGVDYLGPLMVTTKIRGRRPIKMYAAIFICFSSKAIHIELVEDLSTNTFLSAFRCFIARRGHPARVFSDNATNFVGAKNILAEFEKLVQSKAHQEAVLKFCTNEHIEWHFIPPRSPHHGGLWESAVKQVKTHIKRTIGGQILTSAELRTFLTQVESCVNSRPITAMSDGPSDITALTPAHFLIGAPLTSIVQPNLLESKMSSLTRWQLLQHMFQQFWSRWSKEFLTSLQQRCKKWNSTSSNIKLGTLVLLKEDNLPPHQWVLGRVIESFPGKDNLVRVVQVKTAAGEFRRSITKLCPLPIHDDEV